MLPVLLLRPVRRAPAAAPAPALVKSHPALYPGPVSRAQAEAGNYKKRRIEWNGLTLRVENEAGTVREGHGWSTRMLFPYGEVEDTVGLDGDRVDVYIGPALETAPFVYVVHQRKYGRWSEHDEDKVMLGFMSEEEAATAYLAHYDDPRFLGPITCMGVGEFVARCKGDQEVTLLGKSWFGDADLLKAVSKKMVLVPGYYRADGTWVPPHSKHVHYNDEHTFAAIAQGGVSHSQKEAHKKLAKEDWFHKLSMDDKALHVMALATDIQDTKSAAAAITGWKAAATSGKNPTPAQWAAFDALPKEKQAALYDAVGPKLSHLKPPEKPAEEEPKAEPAPVAAPKAEPAKPAAPADPLAHWKAFNATHWSKLQEMDDAQPFLGTQDAGVAALAAYSSGGFSEINQKPDDPVSKAAAEFVAKLPDANVPEMHRALGFMSDKEALSFIESLAEPQKRTFSSWTTKDPKAPGQTPMNNIALDLAASNGDHTVILSLKQPKGAKDVSFIYSQDGNSKPGYELLLPAGTKLQVNNVKKVGSAFHVELSHASTADTGPKDGDTKPGADGSTLVFKDGHWHKQDEADPLAAYPGKYDLIPKEVAHKLLLDAGFKFDPPKGNFMEWHLKVPGGTKNGVIGTGSVSKDAVLSMLEHAKGSIPDLNAINSAFTGGGSSANANSHQPGDATGMPAYDFIAQKVKGGADPITAGTAWLKDNPGKLSDLHAAMMDQGLSLAQFKMAVQGASTFVPERKAKQPPAQSAKDYLDAHGGDADDVQEAAVEWLHANKGHEAELAQALVDMGHSDIAADMDLPVPGEEDEEQAAAPAPAPEKPSGEMEQINAIAASTTPAISDEDAVTKLAEIEKSGSFYQKEALKKLKATQGWAGLTPSLQYAAVSGLYKQLQGAASQAAAVSMWKKSLLAGKVPTPAQQKAWLEMAKTDYAKASAAMQAVAEVIGGKAAADLIKKANDAMPAAPVPAAAPIPGNVTMTPVKAAAPAPAATPAPTPAPAKKISVSKTILHNTNDGHSKQWAVYVVPNGDGTASMVTEYGKIGGTQQQTSKPFPNATAAHAAAIKLKNEKMKGGYSFYDTLYDHEVTVAGAHPAAAPATPSPASLKSYAQIAQEAQDEWKAQGSAIGNVSKKAITQALAWLAQGKPGAAQQVMLKLPANSTGGKFVIKKLLEASQGQLPDGPKEGETKQGADGMLVFKNGRWHKMGQGKLSAAQVNAITSAYPHPLSIGAKKLILQATDAAQAGDAKKLSSLAAEAEKKNYLNTGKIIKALHQAVAGTAPSPAAAPAKPAASPAPTSAPAAAAAPTAPYKAPKPGEPTDIAAWQKVGGKLGSNEGGTFTDKLGQKWYAKFPASEEIARNEVLAAKFYQMLGFSVPNLKLVKRDGKVGIASKWDDSLKKGKAAELSSAAGMHEGFVVDAWLANWDVVGPDYTNTQITKDGKAHRVDVGGSLLFRAQGGKKADFDGVVKELESLLDPGKNASAKAVFAGASNKALMHGVHQLNRLKPSQITELVEKIGPGSTKEKADLAQVLIERRAFILKKYGVADQWASVAKLDPTKLPVDPKILPPPVEFKASSKPWKNAANNADAAALIAAAASGNLVALKDYKYDAFDDATGNPIGKKSIIDHPSQKLKTQWSELVALLQSIQSPALPTLEMPSLGSADSIEAISDFVGAFNPEERPETVSVEHRAGYFMKLAVIDDIKEMADQIKPFYLKSANGTQHQWLAATKAQFAKIVNDVKVYIHAVQDTGWVNRLWSSGKKVVDVSSHHISHTYHGGLQKLTKEIYDNSHEIPEGAILTRGMTDGTAGKQTIKALLAAKPGTVFQNTDSMCSSFYEGHGWPGDMVLKIRCAKGARGTPSWASGRFGSEHEITTLPGQRFVLLGAEMKGSKLHAELLMLPPHEGYVAQIGAMAALGKALRVLLFRKA